jgi:hypothetical protein
LFFNMKLSTAKKVVKVTAAVTAIGCALCMCANAPIIAVFLALVGYVVMFSAASSINPGAKRPRAARRRFLQKHHENLESFDTNELLIGSSAWVIANGLTSAFQTSDSVSFPDSLNTFDQAAFPSNFYTDVNISSGLSIIDSIHGGTDSTGMGGATGHNDQGWGTDSYTSIGDGLFTATSHDSFSSSSHDPFA